VVEAWRRATQPVARAVYRGTPGHPVVIGRAAFSDFESAGGDNGGRAVLGRLEVCEVDFDVPPPADIDTWEQYEAARRGH
jgi:CTP:molybdopterin cytidylyltransferase MocA